ncbi:protein PRY1 isoform X2 [Nematostella vectensis]|uniref:protein PRY1 isoform X2 n=1 Tax=Nematostella vectensis TaxID=45351 RepID=UPI0020774423|nr:protein PRY1 isoform X2 [Nematostella vectensis]
MAILKELPTLIFILGLLQLSVSKHVHKGQAYKRHLLNVKRQLANQACCAAAQAPPMCCEQSPPLPSCCQPGLKPGQAKNITLNGGGRQFLLQVKLIPLLGQTIPPTANPTTIIPSGTSTAVPTAAPTVGSTPSSGVSTPLGGPTTPVSSTVLPSGGQVGGQVQDIAQCRQAALAETNIKRQLHAAPAMTLDPKLNQDAQAWATKIAVDKNPIHSAINTRPGQGENVAKRCQQVDMPFDENCKLGVDLWYKESNNYDFQSPGYSPATGHFTQLVWKASTRMGIGRASYVMTTGIKCVVLVARYSPPGNVKLQFPQNVQPATGNVLSDKPSDKQKKPRKPVYLE